MAKGKEETKFRKAKAADKEYIIRDSDGLEMRVYPSGAKVWQFRYTAGGARRIQRLGTYPAMTLAAARVEAKISRDLLRDGVDPKVKAEQDRLAKEEAERQAKLEQAARKTFKEVFMLWNETKLSTRKDGADLLRAFGKDIFPRIGDHELGALRRGDLMACLDPVAKRAPRMANRMLAALKTLYGWAQLRDYIENNPLSPVKAADLGGRRPARDRFLPDAEIVELFRKLPESGLSPQARAVLLIVLSTGCRLGEICAAQWAHVNGDQWTIPAENAKNKMRHVVTLSPFALEQFDVLRQVEMNRWCLPSPKIDDAHQTRISISGAVSDRQNGTPRKGRVVSDALVLAGGHWTPHDLRRTCASGMQRLGIMPGVIDACLNHKETKGVTQIYQRYDYSVEAAAAWKAWGKRLASLRAQAAGLSVVLKSAAGA